MIGTASYILKRKLHWESLHELFYGLIIGFSIWFEPWSYSPFNEKKEKIQMSKSELTTKIYE